MPGGRSRYSFVCPNCDALYELVKLEAGPETVDRAIACRSCDAAVVGEGRQVGPEVLPTDLRDRSCAVEPLCNGVNNCFGREQSEKPTETRQVPA
jgi:hypothetical protein